MLLTAGMGPITDFPVLSEAGADEIFTGYCPLEWRRRFEAVGALNRREVLYYPVQPGCLTDMEILKSMAEEAGIRVAITFNALTYTPAAVPYVLTFIRELYEIGFRDFIVADLNLLRLLSESGLPLRIHVSGEFGEWSRESFRFLKQHFSNITRIIFHRKMTPEEMGELIRYGREIGLAEEYEAFFLNEKCHYAGAYCNSLHGDSLRHLCLERYCLSGGRREPEEDVPGEESPGCGLCALFRLQEAGITHLKIVGRGNPGERTAEDLRRGGKALEALAASENNEEYVRHILERKKEMGCGLNCYY